MVFADEINYLQYFWRTLDLAILVRVQASQPNLFNYLQPLAPDWEHLREQLDGPTN